MTENEAWCIDFLKRVFAEVGLEADPLPGVTELQAKLAAVRKEAFYDAAKLVLARARIARMPEEVEQAAEMLQEMSR